MDKDMESLKLRVDKLQEQVEVIHQSISLIQGSIRYVFENYAMNEGRASLLMERNY